MPLADDPDDPTMEALDRLIERQMQRLPSWWYDDIDGVDSPSQGKKGEDNSNAKITPEIVREVRERVATGERPSAVAKSLGLTNQHVYEITSRRRWKHIT